MKSSLKNALSRMRSLGPYLLMELLLPGGTVLALLLWLSQEIRNVLPGVYLPVVPSSTVERVVTLPESLHACEACAV